MPPTIAQAATTYTSTSAVGPGPDDRDHAGRYVDQGEQQVADDRSRAVAAERSRALQEGVAERVDREQDDQREDRSPPARPAR